MLGYVADHKGYRLFDLATKRIFASRDVKFHEENFPYKELTIKPSPAVPLPLVPYFEDQTKLPCSLAPTSSLTPDTHHELPC